MVNDEYIEYIHGTEQTGSVYERVFGCNTPLDRRDTVRICDIGEEKICRKENVSAVSCRMLNNRSRGRRSTRVELRASPFARRRLVDLQAAEGTL